MSAIEHEVQPWERQVRVGTSRKNGRAMKAGETIIRFSGLCRVVRCNQAAPASHSRSFDHRRLDPLFFTAIAIAFRWPISTTSFLPRVTPV